jgi:hypothetical protein
MIQASGCCIGLRRSDSPLPTSLGLFVSCFRQVLLSLVRPGGERWKLRTSSRKHGHLGQREQVVQPATSICIWRCNKQYRRWVVRVAKSLKEWIDTEVREVKDKPLSWLSQYHFFRDPTRPMFSDTSHFFAPADGVILYQKTVAPDECLLDIKGKSYSIRQVMRDESYDQPSLVIGIFMTFYDVHINRIPFPGRLSYRELDPIATFNYPMLEVEKGIIEDLHILF